MLESDEIAYILLTALSRIFLVVLVYCFTGLVLIVFNFPGYDDNLDIYVSGFILSLIWLLLVTYIKKEYN